MVGAVDVIQSSPIGTRKVSRTIYYYITYSNIIIITPRVITESVYEPQRSLVGHSFSGSRGGVLEKDKLTAFSCLKKKIFYFLYRQEMLNIKIKNIHNLNMLKTW